MVHTRFAKVPEITILFWLAKITTTAFGEAFSDFLATTFDPYIVVPLAGIILAFALWCQFRTHRYQPFYYWLAVTMVAVFGTMIADVMHKQFGVSYVISTGAFLVILGLIFAIWYRIEKTLSIHSITTQRRELFYWLTVMATFTLGTAAGDWTAGSLGFGYLWSGIIFGICILLPLTGYITWRRNTTVLFWLAYIITRPLGASFADWFGKPVAMTGLGYGDGTVSLCLFAILLGCVWYMITNHREHDAETHRVTTS